MQCVSGGGLWYADLCKRADGSFVLFEKAQLEGVAFYLTAREGDYVRLRCHGRASIYDGITELHAAVRRRLG